MTPDQWKKIGDFLANEALPIAIAAIFLGAPAVFIERLAQLGNDRCSAVDYRLAADQTRWPNPKFVSASLVGFKFDHPVTVVTFTQARWVPNYQQPNPTTTATDVWVTVVPFVKAFCQEFVRSHGADSDQLAMRLKERLGLPPDGDYDTFVELTVDPKDANAKMIRPCGDSSLDINTCQPPTLPAASAVWAKPTGSTQFQEWMLRNYYSTYSTQTPYPWTALGYTFDWARKGDTDDFERYGESEFVIPKGSPVHFVSAASITSYCAPP